ncbi:MAG TPA: DUF2378 family protein [Myxococcales bacterium]|nr:DUF2378 family protein [Myxococcales bacterium]
MGDLPPAGAIPAETTDYAVFEGMFRRTLHVEPSSPLADALREVGFDLRAPKGRYPSEVWDSALKVAARHQYPDRTEAEGLLELGRRFTAGFFETIVGKVIASIIPFLGMERMMVRVPKFAAMTTSGMNLDVQREGDGRWRLRYRSRTLSPEFLAGAVEGGLARTRMPVSVQIENRTAEGFDLVVTEAGKGT